MSKVLSPQTARRVGDSVGVGVAPGAGGKGGAAPGIATTTTNNNNSNKSKGNMDDYTCSSSSSILEFLAKEQDCNGVTGIAGIGGGGEVDPESIFREVSRLSDSSDMRSVDELLLEAERLIQKQLRLGRIGATGGGDDSDDVNQDVATARRQGQSTPLSPSPLSSPHSTIRLNKRFTRRIEMDQKKTTTATTTPSPSVFVKSISSSAGTSITTIVSPQKDGAAANQNNNFSTFVDNLPSESIISEESTPKDMHNRTETLTQLQLHTDNTDDDEDTMEDLTEAENDVEAIIRRNSTSAAIAGAQRGQQHFPIKPIKPMASYCEKAVGSSPKHLVSTLSSPIESMMSCSAANVSREHALKHEIEQLQEQLKDTEERLASIRLQSDSLSQTQRSLREHNSRLQEESEMLKLDVQHLNECAGVLRSELQAARRDRAEALQMQNSLRAELDEVQQERKRAADGKEKDAKVIQDLQRQCREMERILMRKHPDSVSALIVASKSPGICSLNDQENLNSRKLLEQRIAQLESDAKEQDSKAQQILANVQARFNSVQAKYETHIADLETQVLSLQEINTKLNEQIESQVRTLDRYMQHRADRFYNNCTQTEETTTAATEGDALHTAGSLAVTGYQPNSTAINTTTTETQTTPGSRRDHATNTIGCTTTHVHGHGQAHSASSSTSSTANSTPNTSRPNSKQSGQHRRPPAIVVGGSIASKLPISQSESTLSLLTTGSGNGGGASGSAKDDTAHLLSSVRSMRVDLAIKNKAMQRLTRELDDCKKTIKKLQRERGPGNGAGGGSKLPQSSGSSLINSSGLSQRRGGYDHHYYHHDHIPATTENQALKEAQNKYRLLEADYKTLHDKRLQDLKTLQSAHERELASCNDAVRILQQRLNERDEATQKRRKVPVDYYALKAKVSLLERRHSEREERLHILVDALSKGRLNGALEDLLQDNNNK
ncbi:uncharacterized protein Dwil_GK25152 [Drosophila willistoni]|uniref:Centrosomal protein of 162 kDa n=1 Tax=Drosophila willistoni TaxID=7260 RepID=B4NC31_DROWI|nr:uncharacterized protein Dwil_GK25152 [Drosophila willistoni]